MKSMICAAAVVAFAGSALAGVDDLAYWAQNNNVQTDGDFGFENGDFPQAADFGLQAGSAVLSLSTALNADFDGGTGEYNTVQSFGGSTGNAQFGEGSGGSIAIQNGPSGQNNGEWFELQFDATNYMDIILSFDARRTSTGFDDVDIQAYDGGTLLGDIALDQIWSGSFATEGYTTTLLDGVTDARIRFTLNGGSDTSTNGNNRFDNLFIQASLIPSPGAAALFGLAGLTASRRRRG